jgi:hypothetical protein
MDMGPAYQKAVGEYVAALDIIFARFHVVPNPRKAIQNQRRVGLRKSDTSGKEMMKGTHYLLLKMQTNRIKK